MLSKTFRLPTTASFQKPARFQSPLFFVSVVKNSLPTNRYGFIVSKKIDKRAVVRNRVKRLTRSVIEQEWLDKNAGIDVLFILRPLIKDASPKDIQKGVGKIMTKINS